MQGQNRNDLPVATPEAPNPKPTAATVTGELTLRQALSMALLHNPELSTFSWEVRVKEAEALQAGLLPNPELGIEMENFAGGGEFSGTEFAETTVTLSHLIELGGKRGKRRAAEQPFSRSGANTSAYHQARAEVERLIGTPLETDIVHNGQET